MSDWINVEHELPCITKEVLVVDKYGDFSVAEYSSKSGKWRGIVCGDRIWTYERDDVFIDDVVYWQDLPEPPQ